MGIMLNNLRREPLFQIGLGIKLFLIIILIPKIQQDWFVPFMINWFENPSTLPWTNFLLSGGDVLSFPYGPIMFLVLLPFTLIGGAIDSLIGLNYFSGLGFRLSLLGADIFLLFTLLQQFEKNWKGILIYYWLSPLVIFITYWHGQIDIIPLALLIFSASLLKKNDSSLTISFSMMESTICVLIPLYFR